MRKHQAVDETEYALRESNDLVMAARIALRMSQKMIENARQLVAEHRGEDAPRKQAWRLIY